MDTLQILRHIIFDKIKDNSFNFLKDELYIYIYIYIYY